MLNGIIRWNSQTGIEYEVDTRHVEIMLKQLHLEDSKAAASPGTKEEGTTKDNHNRRFDGEKTRVPGARRQSKLLGAWPR